MNEAAENSVIETKVAPERAAAKLSIWTKMRENRAKNKGWFTRMNSAVFYDWAPRLSEASIDKMMTNLPWISLFGGVCGLGVTAYYCYMMYSQLRQFLDLFGGRSIMKALSVSPDSMFAPIKGITVIYLVEILFVGLYLAICSLLAIIAFNGLRRRKLQGWVLAYRSVTMVAIVSYVSVMSWVVSSTLAQLSLRGKASEVLILPVIISIVGLYILFQVRSRYTS